jgi:hypothetical protein
MIGYLLDIYGMVVGLTFGAIFLAMAIRGIWTRRVYVEPNFLPIEFKTKPIRFVVRTAYYLTAGSVLFVIGAIYCKDILDGL